jgi:hypothetical protein
MRISFETFGDIVAEGGNSGSRATVTVYRMVITDGAHSYRLSKLYSEFYALYKRIKTDPAIMGLPFPGKTLLKLDEPAKDVRCKQLQYFMQQLVLRSNTQELQPETWQAVQVFVSETAPQPAQPVQSAAQQRTQHDSPFTLAM